MKNLLALSLILNIALGALVAYHWLLAGGQETPAANSSDVIVHIAPSISDAEAERIQERVIGPYINYHTCLGEIDQIAIKIDKASASGFLYTFDAFQHNGPNEGFLFGEPGLDLAYYTPALILTECVNELPHADELEDRAVDAYRG